MHAKISAESTKTRKMAPKGNNTYKIEGFINKKKQVNIKHIPLYNEFLA